MIVDAAILIDGVIYTGRRHCIIINSTQERGLPFGYFRKGVQGFVDDKGNFLDRAQAGQHALDCGQLKKLRYEYLKELFSEDLW